MKAKNNISEIQEIGSYLDNMKNPKINETIWALVGFENNIVKGLIVKVSNIDNKGASNTYIDIESDGHKYHINIDQIFDHIPEKVEKQDIYGRYTKWQ